MYYKSGENVFEVGDSVVISNLIGKVVEVIFSEFMPNVVTGYMIEAVFDGIRRPAHFYKKDVKECR